MNVESLTIKDLFKKYSFHIPLYQRSYGWTEKLCSALWEDFVRLYKNEKNATPHYLGTLVVEKLEKMGENYYSIVDGQQRVTSLMLMIKALSMQCDNELDSFLKNEKQQLRLSPQSIAKDDDDKCQFEKAMKGEKGKTVYFENLEYFEKQAKTFLEEDKKLKIEKIEKALELLQVVFVELIREPKDKDDPQLIFEKMNGGGKNLEVHDFIRNYIFMLAAESDDEQSAESDDEQSKDNANQKQKTLFENEWRNLENEFPERRLFQMKHFFRDYLILKTKDYKLTSNNDLYLKFKNWIQGDTFKDEFGDVSKYDIIEKLVNDLWRYADCWGKALFPEHNKYIIANKSPNTHKIQKELKEYAMIGNANTHPLIMEILKQKYESADLLKLLQWLNKFIGLNYIIIGKNIDLRKSLFGDNGLLEKINNINDFKVALLGKFDKSFIKSAIRKSINSTIFFDDDRDEKNEKNESSVSQTKEIQDSNEEKNEKKEENEDKVELADIYSKGKKAVFLLLKINEELTGSDSEVEFIGETKHSLEHIMPQATEKWKDIIEDTDIHQKYLNTLGNMTLVSQSYNSTLSHKEFSKKKKLYEKSSYEITRQVSRKYSDWYENKNSSESLNKLLKDLSKKPGCLSDKIRSQADKLADAIQNDSKSTRLENMFKERSKQLTIELVKVFTKEIV